MDQLAASVQIVDGIDPEDALNLVTPRNPPGIVRVRGQVDSLQPWWSKNNAKSEVPDFYFGTLSSLSNGASIDFKCTGHAVPDVGQLVVLEGALTYERRRNHAGLKILLSGNYLGTFTIPDDVETPLRPEDRAPKKSLANYLEEKDGSLHDLLIIGSDAGIAAIQSTLGDHAAAVRYEKIPLTDFGRALEIIQSVPSDAVVLVRGGDDDALHFWNQRDCIRQLLATGKCFYTALGHAQRLTIADLFADQAFLSPADCGQSIAAELDELKLKNELFSALEKTMNEVKELQEARENDRIWNDRKTSAQMYEFSQFKGKVDAELGILLKEKNLANLWVKMLALFSVVLLGVLLAFVFNVSGARQFLTLHL